MRTCRINSAHRWAIYLLKIAGWAKGDNKVNWLILTYFWIIQAIITPDFSIHPQPLKRLNSQFMNCTMRAQQLIRSTPLPMNKAPQRISQLINYSSSTPTAAIPILTPITPSQWLPKSPPHLNLSKPPPQRMKGSLLTLPPLSWRKSANQKPS